MTPGTSIAYTDSRGIVHFGDTVSGVFVGEYPTVKVSLRVEWRCRIVQRVFLVPFRDVEPFPLVQESGRRAA